MEFQGTFAEFQKDDRIFRHLHVDNENNNEEKNASSILEKTRLADESLISLQLNNIDDPVKVVVEKDHGEGPQETEELIEKRDIRKSLYLRYFRANGSYALLFATALCFVMAQALLSSSTYWIAYW